jgi:hypothetical protein
VRKTALTARDGTLDRPAFAHSGAVEDVKGKARQRSLRWIDLGWEGATTAAREEARKEAVLEMLRSGETKRRSA